MTTIEIWRRICEAVDTERLLPGIDRPAEYGNAWPEIVRDWMAYQRTDPPPVVEVASPAMVARCTEAMGWLCHATPPQRRALLLIARGAPERWIAKRMHCSVLEVRRIGVRALHAIAKCLTRPGKSPTNIPRGPAPKWQRRSLQSSKA